MTRASGLAGLAKPIWLSLSWRKVKLAAFAVAAFAGAPSSALEATPPFSAHSAPVPAQAMHFSASRRSRGVSSLIIEGLRWLVLMTMTGAGGGLFPAARENVWRACGRLAARYCGPRRGAEALEGDPGRWQGRS